MPVVNDGVVGKVYDQIRVFHKVAVLIRWLWGRGRRSSLVAAEYGFNPGNQFFGVEGLNHIVVRTQLQSQHLVEDFSFGGEHDDWNLGGSPQLPADLVAVNARQHQI